MDLPSSCPPLTSRDEIELKVSVVIKRKRGRPRKYPVEEPRKRRQLLAPWLRDQLAQHQPGIEWVDEDAGVFAIYWMHRANFSYRQGDGSIFEKWAQHTNNKGAEKDYKHNFRCAMLSVRRQVEEIPALCTKHRKVFRFIEQESTSAKPKRKPSRLTIRLASSDSRSPSPWRNDSGSSSSCSPSFGSPSSGSPSPRSFIPQSHSTETSGSSPIPQPTRSFSPLFGQDPTYNIENADDQHHDASLYDDYPINRGQDHNYSINEETEVLSPGLESLDDVMDDSFFNDFDFDYEDGDDDQNSSAGEFVARKPAAIGNAAIGTAATGSAASAATGTATIGTAAIGTAATGTADTCTTATGTAATGTAATGTEATGTAASETLSLDPWLLLPSSQGSCNLGTRNEHYDSDLPEEMDLQELNEVLSAWESQELNELVSAWEST